MLVWALERTQKFPEGVGELAKRTVSSEATVLVTEDTGPRTWVG